MSNQGKTCRVMVAPGSSTPQMPRMVATLVSPCSFSVRSCRPHPLGVFVRIKVKLKALSQICKSPRRYECYFPKCRELLVTCKTVKHRNVISVCCACSLESTESALWFCWFHSESLEELVDLLINILDLQKGNDQRHLEGFSLPTL